jgi:hypothetical protein
VDLEDRVFSDSRIRELAKDFVCVAIDPREQPGEYAAAQAYKATRYVPEVVFLTPDLRVLKRLEPADFTVPAVASIMERVLAKMRSPGGSRAVGY